ncbi:hypothetical protein ABT158_17635 [Nonomuraea sp. NPDC001636]|uniref:hypothetical protein n=1 Tax=Nonomuraea sp. NPDC001636 TaxID=3154391 RepID=UPI0033322191
MMGRDLFIGAGMLVLLFAGLHVLTGGVQSAAGAGNMMVLAMVGIGFMIAAVALAVSPNTRAPKSQTPEHPEREHDE